MKSVLNLAIFAEVYIICDLKNKTLDILRTEFGSGRWELTPDDISTVYDNAPSSSIIRQLCSMSLALQVEDHQFSWGSTRNTRNVIRQHTTHSEWKTVFEQHSNLGWDYFREAPKFMWFDKLVGCGLLATEYCSLFRDLDVDSEWFESVSSQAGVDE